MNMLADTRGIKINDKDKKELTDKFSTMPPHPEVPAALRKLRDAGFRLFTLTQLAPPGEGLLHVARLGDRRRLRRARGFSHGRPTARIPADLIMPGSRVRVPPFPPND